MGTRRKRTGLSGVEAEHYKKAKSYLKSAESTITSGTDSISQTGSCNGAFTQYIEARRFLAMAEAELDHVNSKSLRDKSRVLLNEKFIPVLRKFRVRCLGA